MFPYSFKKSDQDLTNQLCGSGLIYSPEAILGKTYAPYSLFKPNEHSRFMENAVQNSKLRHIATVYHLPKQTQKFPEEQRAIY